MATEQVGSGGRIENYTGDLRDLPPVETWGAVLEEADCLQGGAGLLTIEVEGRPVWCHLGMRPKAVGRAPVLSLSLGVSWPERVLLRVGAGWSHSRFIFTDTGLVQCGLQDQLRSLKASIGFQWTEMRMVTSSCHPGSAQGSRLLRPPSEEWGQPFLFQRLLWKWGQGPPGSVLAHSRDPGSLLPHSLCPHQQALILRIG